MQIKTNKKAGFTLVEIMIVVAIIGLLAAIAIPNFVKARETAQLNSIFNNLRIIEGAKDQWALESKNGTGRSEERRVGKECRNRGTVNPYERKNDTTDKVSCAANAVTSDR